VRFRQGAARLPAVATFAALVLSPLAAPGPAAAFIDPPEPGVLNAPPVLPMAGEPRFGDGLDAGRGHEGVDLFAPAGTPLVAVDDAVVLETGSDGGRGNYVAIYDPRRDRTYSYLHMLAPAPVAPGQRVDTGEELGQLGCTGSCWGNHLHFELRAGRSPYGAVLDPVPFVEGLEPSTPRRLPAVLRG
jgi:murein DD-endopeptidase MepM/ murein hydrolase activator NlpD